MFFKSKLILEKAFYSMCGNIVIDEYKKEFEFIKNKIPVEFKNKNLIDLGCGDGTNTLRIKNIFNPISVKGYDRINSLIKSAKKKGIESYCLDLEKNEFKGELGILWGTLHHLKSPENFLSNLKNNFQYLFIREKVSNRFFELGKIISYDDLTSLCKKYFNKINIIEYKNKKVHSVFVFIWNENNHIHVNS
ncbi:MAG: class I SAM-dependent methyltransferase [bacterium]